MALPDLTPGFDPSDLRKRVKKGFRSLTRRSTAPAIRHLKKVDRAVFGGKGLGYNLKQLRRELRKD